MHRLARGLAPLTLVVLASSSAAFPLAALAQSRPAPARTPPTGQARPAQPAAQPQRSAAPQQSQIPQPAGLIVLIKGSLIALNQANLTGNYQVLYALGSDSLRASTNAQNLAQSFAGFRQRQIDMSSVLFLNPNLTRQPAIEGGRLHLVGTFPTTPLQINFDFWFEPSQNQWKFVQLNTSLSPVAQQPQQQRR